MKIDSYILERLRADAAHTIAIAECERRHPTPWPSWSVARNPDRQFIYSLVASILQKRHWNDR